MKVQLLTHRYETLTLRPVIHPGRKLKAVRHGRIQSCIPKEDLKGQTVAVVGLGISGRTAARLALARGASVIAIDRNENLAPLEQDPLFGQNGVLKTVLGHCDRGLLEDVDRVVVSPGVPLANYDLSALLQSGKQVLSELDFAAEVLPNCIKILAVTGTNGKSTVTTYAGQILSRLGIKTFVGGNLGNPLSEAAIQCLSSSSTEPRFQAAVAEVSSYQMEIPSRHFSPTVSVVLNLTPDHLERHKTMRNYAVAKCRVFSHMKNNKLAVLPIGNQYLDEALKDYRNECNVARIGAFPGVRIDIEAEVAHLRLPTAGIDCQLQLGALNAMGIHNYHNAAVAAFSVLGLDFGINIESIGTTIETLSSLPHRMQIVHRDASGVTWVDDSKATNVEATYTGLIGLKGQKLVVLLGGLAKVSNVEGSNGFEKLVEPLKGHICVVTFGSSGAIIQKALCAGGLKIPCIRVTNLEDAVNSARRLARCGDAIVLSPGCASFDEFRNFEHRGQVFKKLACRS